MRASLQQGKAKHLSEEAEHLNAINATLNRKELRNPTDFTTTIRIGRFGNPTGWERNETLFQQVLVDRKTKRTRKTLTVIRGEK